MKKLQRFINESSTNMIGAACTLIVKVAETSASASTLFWHYEPELPKCLREE